MAVHLTEAQFRRLERGEPIGRAVKYGNVRTQVDGIWFQSKWESQYWSTLKLRERAGEVREVRRQVRYRLVVEGVEVCSFIADFVFEERHRLRGSLPGLEPIVWREQIVDTKSEATRRKEAYRIKFKLMAALGHHIVEVVAPDKRRARWTKRARQKRRA